MLSSQCIHITHVKQTHMPIVQTNMTNQDFEEIAYSQYNVCRAVMFNPDALVLKESLYENYTPDLVSSNQNAGRAKKLFPNGIPGNYFELNEGQKNYLARRSGVVTLFDLGILSHVYKSIGKGESQQINALVAAKCFDAIYEPRELLAIKYAKEAAKSSLKQDVHILLVFGGAHDFKSRINAKSKNDSVYFNGCIETSMHHQNKNEMTANDIIKDLYALSNDSKTLQNAETSLSKLSIFHATVDNIDVSKIPSSKNELPCSRLNYEIVNEAIQELSSKLSDIRLTQINPASLPGSNIGR